MVKKSALCLLVLASFESGFCSQASESQNDTASIFLTIYNATNQNIIIDEVKGEAQVEFSEVEPYSVLPVAFVPHKGALTTGLKIYIDDAPAATVKIISNSLDYESDSWASIRLLAGYQASYFHLAIAENNTVLGNIVFSEAHDGEDSLYVLGDNEELIAWEMPCQLPTSVCESNP